MEELIELYLFKNKNCPLPSIGILKVTDGNALAEHSDNSIAAPVPTVKLVDSSVPADPFIKFIASRRNMNAVEASDLLAQYCDKLRGMDAYAEAKLAHSGKFYVNVDGELVFKTIDVPKAFTPSVTAVRVVHPDASHTMVVGDKERTNTEMAAYYSETEETAKSRWWIWALSLIAIAAAIIFLYFSNKTDHGFGNATKIESSTAPATYKLVE